MTQTRVHEYREGVEWTGPVPTDWKVRRLGFFFSERRRKVSDKDYAPLSVTMQGVVPQLENVAKTDDGDNRKLVRAGDFVINSRSDRKGSGGVASSDGSVSLINTVLEPANGMHIRFTAYLLTSYPFQEEFYRVGNGIVADMWTTKYSEMKNIRVAVPDEEEQISIASYLDRATTRIDALIARKTRFIELLREKRQAVITHAVTKGLDAGVPMKDSGVEWLGEVPAHWDLVRLRFVASINPAPDWKVLEVQQSTYPFLPMEAIGETGELDTSRRKLLSECRGGYSYFAEGDVAYAKVTPCFENGKGAIMQGLEGGHGFGTTELTVLRARGVDRRFLYALTFAHCFRSPGAAGMLGAGGLKRVPENFAREFRATIPGRDEQVAIFSYIDRATSRIDTLLNKTERSIELLREHRTALITAAVTGKIDLREAA